MHEKGTHIQETSRILMHPFGVITIPNMGEIQFISLQLWAVIYLLELAASVWHFKT